MAPASKQNSKPVFKTCTPYTETKWPEITHEHQEVILELLCNLISLIGDHRRTHIQPSKGKKRKRTTKPQEDAPSQADTSPPPVPEISKHILVGLNSVTRHLEALAAVTAPAAKMGSSKDHQADTKSEENTPPLRNVSIVIIPHPKPSLSLAHTHIPMLVHLASLSSTAAPTILVTLPTAADGRLASALHIPRVGALGVMSGAPGTNTLEEYVREHVGRTECLWVDEAMRGEWKGLSVKSETT